MYEGFVFLESWNDPFSPLIEIRFKMLWIACVKITLYDSAGIEQCVIMEKSLKPGIYMIKWSCRVLKAGVYFIRIESGEVTLQRKIEIV
jgi:hypothetical protein